MTKQEEIEMIARGYKNNIKPLINEGEYFAAYSELGGLIGLLTEQELVRSNNNPSFLTIAKSLQERLREGDMSRIGSAVRIFENYINYQP